MMLMRGKHFSIKQNLSARTRPIGNHFKIATNHFSIDILFCEEDNFGATQNIFWRVAE